MLKITNIKQSAAVQVTYEELRHGQVAKHSGGTIYLKCKHGAVRLLCSYNPANPATFYKDSEFGPNESFTVLDAELILNEK